MRVREGLGRSMRVLEGQGGFQRVRKGLEGSGMIWKGLRGPLRIPEGLGVLVLNGKLNDHQSLGVWEGLGGSWGI